MSGEVLKKFDFGARVLSVQFSPDGSKIVIGGETNEIEVCYWSICTRFQIRWANFDVIIRSETSLPPRSWRLLRVILAMCARSLSALVAARSFLEVMTKPWGYVGNVLGVNWGKTHHCSFTPQVWDFASSEVLQKFDFGTYVYSVQFSPDGSKIVIGGSGGKLEVRCAWFARVFRCVELILT